ncbi:MAG: methionine ABC transporter ATP-binding protein, partial [Acholeplasmataceae bacterium]
QEILGVVGYSGAGKSTLVRLINGLIKPSCGQIIIDGTSIHALKQEDLNRMRYDISMIFQHFNLVSNLNVYDNIKLALSIKKYPKEDIDHRIHEVLDLVGLVDKKHRYPKELSGGEKQRVGIARAISNRPKYLLCDEATSALDQKTAYDIVQLLKTIHKQTKITIVFISHQMEIVKDLCERVVVMDEGRIIEDQPTKNLFVSPKNSITKKLIKQVIDEPVHLKNKNYYELIYAHDNVDDSLLSYAIKTYQIDVNIVYAKTLTINTEMIGYLYLEITGEHIDQAINYLREKDIEVRKYA